MMLKQIESRYLIIFTLFFTILFANRTTAQNRSDGCTSITVGKTAS